MDTHKFISQATFDNQSRFNFLWFVYDINFHIRDHTVLINFNEVCLPIVPEHSIRC